jgi:ketosteroid isomerase-like protein
MHGEGGRVDRLLDELVALERSALDRWIELDPQGYFDLSTSEVTYFDPFTESRVDGLDALQVRFAPMKTMKVPFASPRYEMINPKVQRSGDLAILTFNLVNYGRLPDGAEQVLARWNATQIYSRIGGTWKIIHSHWSFLQAQPNPPDS